MPNNRHEITLNLNKSIGSKKERENTNELVMKAIDYAVKKSNSFNFFGSISQKDGDGRPFSYSQEKTSIPKDPLSLGVSAFPIGTAGVPRGV